MTDNVLQHTIPRAGTAWLDDEDDWSWVESDPEDFGFCYVVILKDGSGWYMLMDGMNEMPTFRNWEWT